MVEKALVFLNVIPAPHLLGHINQIKIVSVPNRERRVRLIKIAHRGGHKIRAEIGGDSAKFNVIRGSASRRPGSADRRQSIGSQTKNAVKSDFLGYTPGRFQI